MSIRVRYVPYAYVVQQVTNKFCRNRSLCDKSTKFYVAIEKNIINDFMMGAMSNCLFRESFGPCKMTHIIPGNHIGLH